MGSRRISRSAVALALAVAACGHEKEAPPAPPPPEVTVVEVASASVPLRYEFPARLEGSREVEVRARVSGILLRRAYAEGSAVERGQLLFVIDPAPYASEVRAAEGLLAEREARVARAERELARIEPLLSRRAVSRREFDEALSEVELSRAALLSTKARLEQARLDLSYTRVEAPISGLSSRAQHSEGSLVEPGENSLLTHISQVLPIWVRFAISDEDLLALRRAVAAKTIETPQGDRFDVELALADGTVHAEHGKVNFSDSVIDRETGSIDLRAEFPNQDRTLVPGQFARVRLLGIERPRTIVVPQRAVQQGQEGKFVFVVDGQGLAQVRPVELGDWVGSNWVVQSGLSAGDRVIVDGTLRVRAGAPVQVVGAPAQEGDRGIAR